MSLKITIAALAMAAVTSTSAAAETARDTVINAITAVFIDRNVDAIDTYFSQDYIQHNPQFPNGTDTLKGFAANFPEGAKYQVGNVISDEEQGLVAVHFRAEGLGPKAMIGVDIFRVEDGLVVEHWDVLQEEVTETVSGNPMWTPAINP